MTAEPNSLSAWAPSPAQQEVAQRYALGYSWNRSGIIAGVGWTTIAYWREHSPEFVEYCEGLREESVRSASPQFAGIIEKAQSILLRVGDDLDPDSPLARWAERILERTLWPVMVARGMAAAGVTIDRGQSVRLAAGQYGSLGAGGGDR